MKMALLGSWLCTVLMVASVHGVVVSIWRSTNTKLKTIEWRNSFGCKNVVALLPYVRLFIHYLLSTDDLNRGIESSMTIVYIN